MLPSPAISLVLQLFSAPLPPSFGPTKTGPPDLDTGHLGLRIDIGHDTTLGSLYPWVRFTPREIRLLQKTEKQRQEINKRCSIRTMYLHCPPHHLDPLPRLLLLTWHLLLLPEDENSFKGILLLPSSVTAGVKTQRPLWCTIPSSFYLPSASLSLLLGFWDITSHDIEKVHFFS